MTLALSGHAEACGSAVGCSRRTSVHAVHRAQPALLGAGARRSADVGPSPRGRTRGRRRRATLGRVNARSRLAVCLGLGVIGFGVAFVLTEWQVAILAGWDVTSAAFILIVFLGIRGKD